MCPPRFRIACGSISIQAYLVCQVYLICLICQVYLICLIYQVYRVCWIYQAPQTSKVGFIPP